MTKRGRKGALRGLTWPAIAVGCVLVVGATSGFGPPAEVVDVHRSAAAPIPAFARLYGTACSTCHNAAPKLNVLGEAFRLNGYRLPDSELLERRDDPIPLGSEPWKDLWPRAIWPSELPGLAPFALRVQSDFGVTRDEEGETATTFRFPHEIYLLAGAPLGAGIGAFFESEWTRENGFEVLQAKIAFQNPITALPSGLLNLWVGQQNLYLFTFADRQIDRAARQKFAWQGFRSSDVEAFASEGGAELRSEGDFQLATPQPAIEINGLITDRLYYGFGVAQGTAAQSDDDNTRKDVYYKVRYKFGGLNLRGKYDPGGGPVPGAGGQLLDRSLIIEHFGYFGGQPVGGGVDDDHRSFGVSVRALQGPLDVGVGYVRSHHDSPWGLQIPGALEISSWFGKLEYMGLPWLIGSVKLDRFQVTLPSEAVGPAFDAGRSEKTRIMPGVVFLVRQNIRAVIEAELFLKDTRTNQASFRRPHALWVRLDYSF